MFSSLHQGFVSGIPQKCGVVGYDLDGPSNLVFDSLTGAMPTGEKLKVGRVVEGPVSVFMMDRFFGGKLAPNNLFHIISVLKDFFAFNTANVRPPQSNIAITDYSLGNLSFSGWAVSFPIGKFLSFATFCAANAAGFHKRFAISAINWGDLLPALHAFLVPFFSLHAPAFTCAWNRAVEWGTPVFVGVGLKCAGHQLKPATAMLAGEINRLGIIVKSAVSPFIAAVTHAAAKFSLLRRSAFELCLAVDACRNHRFVSCWCGRSYHYHTRCGVAMVNNATGAV